MLQIKVDEGRNIDCKMGDCIHNEEGKCKSIALDISEDTECETYETADGGKGVEEGEEEEGEELGQLENNTFNKKGDKMELRYNRYGKP